jgi:iron(III) transport system permease protein
MGVLLIGFVVPVSQLLYWCIEVFGSEFDYRYFGFVFRTIFFAFSAALIITLCALLLSYAQRLHTDRFTKLIIRISTLGYALPGTVLAVGIFIVFVFADNILIQILRRTAGINTGPLIQGTFITVIAAYMVRFMAVGFNSISSAMHRVTPNLDEASISLGISGLALVRRVHLPILKGGIFTAAILVFVDVMKEMPITLMTRPFGWDTLAVKIYELTSEGEWERAALPALALIMAGLIPVAILTRKTEVSGKILRGIENGNGS